MQLSRMTKPPFKHSENALGFWNPLLNPKYYKTIDLIELKFV